MIMVRQLLVHVINDVTRAGLLISNLPRVRNMAALLIPYVCIMPLV